MPKKATRVILSMIAALPQFTIRFLDRIADLVAAIVVFIGFLFCKLIRLIHSELRLLCGVDAAIGAGIGFFFNAPVVGAVVGGMFGVFNFEIVSIRWMKVVPITQSFFYRQR
jgi:hypothetical protein